MTKINLRVVSEYGVERKIPWLVKADGYFNNPEQLFVQVFDDSDYEDDLIITIMETGVVCGIDHMASVIYPKV
jgi:uncharacterized protein YuzE